MAYRGEAIGRYSEDLLSCGDWAGLTRLGLNFGAGAFLERAAEVVEYAPPSWAGPRDWLSTNLLQVAEQFDQGGWSFPQLAANWSPQEAGTLELLRLYTSAFEDNEYANEATAVPESGRFQAAMQACEMIYSISESIHDSASAAQAANRAGGLLLAAGEPSAAIEVLQHSLSHYELIRRTHEYAAVWGASERSAAVDFAVAFLHVQDAEQAARCCQTAIDLTPIGELDALDKVASARAYHVMAESMREQARYDDELASLTKAEGLYRSLADANPELAIAHGCTLVELAQCPAVRGKPARRLAWIEDSLGPLGRHTGLTSLASAPLINALILKANLELEQNQRDYALQSARRAVSLGESASDQGEDGLAELLAEAKRILSVVHANRGEHDSAAVLLRDSSSPSVSHRAQPIQLHAEAYAAMQSGDHGSAAAGFEHVSNLLAELGSGPLAVAHSRCNAAAAYLEHGRFGSIAILPESLRKAWELCQSVGDTLHGRPELQNEEGLATLVNAFLVMAEVLSLNGRSEERFQVLLEAREHAVRLGELSPHGYWEPRMYALGGAGAAMRERLQKTGEEGAAFYAMQWLAEAAALGEMWRAAAGGSVSREACTPFLGQVNTEVVAVCNESERLGLELPGSGDMAFAAAERMRSRTLTELLAAKAELYLAGPSPEADRLRKLCGEIEDLERRVAMLEAGGFEEWSVPPHARDQEIQKQRFDRIAHLRASLESTYGRLSEASKGLPLSPEDATVSLDSIPTAEDFRTVLPDEHTAFVHLVVGSDGMNYAVATWSDGGCVVDLSSSWSGSIDARVLQWVASSVGPQSESRVASPSELDGVLYDVGVGFLDPTVHALPASIKRLLISPNRGLHLLPLHACMLQDGQRLVDRYEVGTCPSAAVYYARATAVRQRAPAVTLVDVRGEHDKSELPFATAERDTVMRRALGGRVAETGDNKGQLASRLSGADVIHFVGHAKFDHEDAMGSGFRMDGVAAVTVREVLREFQLDASPLVVLNGCESGVQSISKQDDQFGPIAAYLFAGARCVVSTLWRVDDQVGLLFADRFYSRLADGETFGTAFSQTLAFLRGATGELVSGQAVADYFEREQLLEAFADPRDRDECREQIEQLVKDHPDEAPFADPWYWATYTLSGAAYPPRSTRDSE